MLFMLTDVGDVLLLFLTVRAGKVNRAAKRREQRRRKRELRRMARVGDDACRVTTLRWQHSYAGEPS